MKQTPLFMTVIVVVGLSSNLVVAQSRSAVQFYDTTGTAKTGKMGWSGDAATGHFFLQTPNQGELIKSTANGVEITGTVSATG